MATDYRKEIEAAAATFRLDPNLVEAVVLTESSGKTDAFRFEPQFYQTYLADNPTYKYGIPRRISSSYGLMQCMYPVAHELGFRGQPEELFLPAVGLFYGCKKLHSLLEWSKGDVDKALGAYNAGKGGWRSEAGRAYVAKVRRFYKPAQLESQRADVGGPISTGVLGGD